MFLSLRLDAPLLCILSILSSVLSPCGSLHRVYRYAVSHFTLSESSRDRLPTAAVMVSAPPLIAWRYRAEPAVGSPEEALVRVLQHPRQWT